MNFYEQSTEDIKAYAHNLFRTNRDNQDTFEAISNLLVKCVYNDFRDEDGKHLFALVRIFKLIMPDNLPPEGIKNVDDTGQWLALMATTGLEDAWNNRLDSAGHRLIPTGVFETPMLKAAFSQLGLQEKDGQYLMKSSSFMANHFHVEQASDSPYIVVQDKFVKHYDIQSVVGIGSVFPSKSFYLLLGFALSPLNKDDAEKFALLSPHVSTLLSTCDAHQPVW